MPPEAWPSNHRADDDTPVDLLMHASFDVYSLGIVAHQLLTGLTQPVACGQVGAAAANRGVIHKVTPHVGQLTPPSMICVFVG